MSTVTFSSGVHVGARSDPADWRTWFSATPTVQFTTFTLTLDDAQVLTSAEGRLGDREPVLMRFQGRGMAASYDLLKSVDARALVNGEPRVTISGFADAVAREGRLLKAAFQLRSDAVAREEWGILAGVRNLVDGSGGWSVTATFYPCDLLLWSGTNTVFLSPVAYEEHVESYAP
jgi:hypothetical protein